MSSDNERQRASTAWTGPMPEPSIPPLNAYAPTSTFTSNDAASSSPSLVPTATEMNMPAAAHYVRPNAYATPYDKPSMVDHQYISYSGPPTEIGTDITTTDNDGTVVMVPAPAQIAEHNGGHGLAAPLAPSDPYFQNTSNDYKLNGAGPTSASAIPPASTPQQQAPPKVILILRCIQLIASVGTLGFLAGASSVSNKYILIDKLLY
jgi:hypothetical protein